MKVVRIYVAVAVVCFIIGSIAPLFLPETAEAIPQDCNWDCYVTVVCDIGSCTSCPYHPCRPTSRYFAQKNDIECNGPFNCDTVMIGCTACQALIEETL